MNWTNKINKCKLNVPGPEHNLILPHVYHMERIKMRMAVKVCDDTFICFIKFYNVSPPCNNTGAFPRQALCSAQGCQIKSRIPLIDLWHRDTEIHRICSHATGLFACKLQANIRTLGDNDAQGQIFFLLRWCWLDSPHSLILWNAHFRIGE